MDLSGKRVLVTGGSGFIGSHLAERLVADGNEVVVADDCSNGRNDWVPDSAAFYEVDLTDPESVSEVVGPDVDIVFHLAARKDPNDEDPRGQFQENTTMTHLLLEECRAADVDGFAFASSSTVYGEAPRPTPEDYGPLEPISVYGGAKLGEEGLVSTYAHSHGLNCWIYRFANVVGPRLRGAVIPDFIEKLRTGPERLVILGDGRQEKSYMHVEDCVDGMCHVVSHAEDASSGRPLHTYNLGTKSTTSVTEIADIVSDTLDFEPTYEYTGGERGWTGDVSRMRLSIERLEDLGWEPTLSSDEAVARAAEELAAELS